MVFHSRSLQDPRPPSTVSVTVWKMYYIHQHIPLRSHYPRGLRGNTPKVCPFPHAYFQWGSELLSLDGNYHYFNCDWRLEFCCFWLGLSKGSHRRVFVGSVSVSVKNGQWEASMFILMLGNKQQAPCELKYQLSSHEIYSQRVSISDTPSS